MQTANGIDPLSTPLAAPTTGNPVNRSRVDYATTELARIIDNCLGRRSSPFACLRRYSGLADIHLSELVELVTYSRTHPKTYALTMALMSNWPESLADLLHCVDQLQLAQRQ
jgi:hypothetical protein